MIENTCGHGFTFRIFPLSVKPCLFLCKTTYSLAGRTENITRIKNLNSGESTLRAMTEIGSALLAATLSYLALFLPFLLVPGLISLLFKELVMVIAGIVVLSLLIALTITPLITDRLIKKGHTKRGIGHILDKVNDYAAEGYGKLLTISLRFKWVVVLIAVVLLGLGIYLFGVTGSEFLPEIDDGRVMVKLILPAGTSVEKTNGILAGIEQKIKDNKIIQSYFTTTTPFRFSKCNNV